MKNVWFCVLLFSTFSSQGQQDSSRKIGPDKFEKGISKQGIQVLDVRTSGEYQGGHIKNALLADWNDKNQFNDRIKYVDKDKPVYIYCAVGGRSSAAAAWMRENGFANVLELNGGFNEWKKERKPVEGMSNEPQMTIEQYWAKIPKDKTTLVDFGASWCPPCVKMAPVIDELETVKDLNFLLVKIDAGLHTDIQKALNIEPIPVFIIYKDGKEIWRKQGVVSKEELLAQLK
ncbi:MAG TPA: rhodanese-like domain-containing protein [Chitinophagaceae bacterium]|nr:rhodanese-like domain-containing protein [Chitinophagaceae bacterium]